jgi:hypothetical protein
LKQELHQSSGVVNVEDMGGQVLLQLKSCYLGIGKAFSAQHKTSMIK